MSEQGPRQTQERRETAESGGESQAQAAAARDRRQTLAKTTQIIWLLTGILEALIGIRFILKLLAANPQAGFARFIYGITSVFLVPFLPLFENPSANGWVLEVSSLVAMLVYALGAWGLVRVIWVTLEESPRHGGGPGASA